MAKKSKKVKVRIEYPATVFVARFVMIDELQYTEMVNDSNKWANFIYDEVMPQREKNWTEPKMLQSACEAGYVKFKLVDDV